MPDTNFDCPHCGQNLDAPDDMAGMEITCPACEVAILVPGVPQEELTELPASSEDEKKGSTMRLELPKNSMPPPPRTRVVKIKRVGK